MKDSAKDGTGEEDSERLPWEQGGKVGNIKRLQHGVHRVPSVLLLAPEVTLAEIHLLG